MSVLPVSEALKQLEHEGLVESRPRVGTRIRIPSPKEIRGILEVREALECHAVRLFCERVTREERAEVKRLAVEVDKLNNRCVQSRGGHELWLKARDGDMSLHLKIAEYGRCEPLYGLLQQNLVLARNLFNIVKMGGRSLFHKKPLSSTAHQDLHQDLIDTVSRDDPDRAEAAMRNHIHSSLQGLFNGLHAWLRWDEEGFSAPSVDQRVKENHPGAVAR